MKKSILFFILITVYFVGNSQTTEIIKNKSTKVMEISKIDSLLRIVINKGNETKGVKPKVGKMYYLSVPKYDTLKFFKIKREKQIGNFTIYKVDDFESAGLSDKNLLKS